MAAESMSGGNFGILELYKDSEVFPRDTWAGGMTLHLARYLAGRAGRAAAIFDVLIDAALLHI